MEKLTLYGNIHQSSKKVLGILDVNSFLQSGPCFMSRVDQKILDWSHYRPKIPLDLALSLGVVKKMQAGRGVMGRIQF